jgi:hypothetical protein
VTTERAAEYKIAKTLRVVREGTGHASRLYIDGVPFDYATVDGFSVHPKRGEMPGVTVTIAAWRVELVDDVDAGPGELSPGGTELRTSREG